MPLKPPQSPSPPPTLQVGAEQAALAASFVEESRALLEEAGDALLALERDPGDQGAINALFRAVHSIKGAAGLFDLPALVHLVHAGEDLLGAMREGRVRMDGAAADELLEGLDHVGQWIGLFQQGGALPPTAMEIARRFAGAYRLRLEQTDGPAQPAAAAGGRIRHDWAEAQVAAIRDAGGQDGPLVTVEYCPDATCFFSGEDPLHVARTLPGLVWFAIAPREDWPAAPLFDPYVCNLRIRLASCAPVEAVEEHFRYMPDAVTIGLLDEVAPSPAAAGPAAAALPPLAAELVEAQRRALAEPARAGQVDDIAATLRNLCAALGRPVPFGDAPDAEALAVAVAALLAPGPPADDAAAVVADTPGDAAPIAGPSRPDTAERTLRVEQGRIDMLMNLVGELVVAKNALPFLARDAENRFGSRELAREIKDKYAVIDRITRQMQGAVMGIRMMPVSDLFKRFPRLVRDIARKQDKRVQLVVEGETTEADKNVIEALAEPLTHILRNSLDHGIESGAARRAAGKPEVATVRLVASQEGDSVVIAVSDDGRGVDPSRVRAKAIERGLIDAERAAQLTDEQAVQLVFLPGFSTAETISDLSGRGVGMDAVRSVVERLGGEVTLRSQHGEGTTVRLRLPLSMAVTRVLTIDLAGQAYGVPMDLVVETVRADPAAIRRLKAAEAIVLRDTVIPLVRLRAMLGMEPHHPPLESVLILRLGDAMVGLVVDDFGTSMDIILKPFSGILANMSGFSGTAVLGDGRVLLVLNLKEML
ncbi:chemotaxis protein CheA [Erythrobacter sp. WG]|uniref:chemotaxis protein CheA n=1 Tax=Erythrobacter sp. WG TaxID=2985510 RepID=UPI00226FA27D|nr:chemotaxis protein CheA [Erythrobacter sp. WG]MCX9147356.1 chemotaxis protein CheA [Erythrobacter sp. WG]